MKTVAEYALGAEFLGNEMTEQQANRFIDEAVQDLSQAELKELSFHVMHLGPLYTMISERLSERGCFG
jgi:hypothetical protein